jgi:hypothetical protein
MTDEPAPDPKPAEGEAPAEPAPEARPERVPSEAPAQGQPSSAAPEEGEGHSAAESPEAAPTATDAAGEPVAAGEAAAPEPAPEAEEPQPEPTPAPAPPQNYDGLESGLAWFGAEPSLPPVPVGYARETAEQAAERESAAELTEEELDLRRRRIKGRYESRRKEAETQKPIHRRIPLGLLSIVPVLVVLVVMAILYPPWQGGVFTDSKQLLNEALLTAAPLPDEAKALSDLGILDAAPTGCWGVLPDNVLRMAAAETSAKLVFALPTNFKNFEIACDVCVVDRDPNSWGVSIVVDQSAGIQVMAHPKKPGFDYVAGRIAGGNLAGHEHHLKLKTWNEMKIIIGASGTQYAFNGKVLKATMGRPTTFAQAEFNTYGARILVRNWRVSPIE